MVEQAFKRLANGDAVHAMAPMRDWAAKEWRFLAEASELLASTLDHETTLRSITRLAVASVADFCFLDLFEGPLLVRAAWAHSDPRMEPLVERARAFPVDRNRPDNPTNKAIASGKVVFALLDDEVRSSLARSDPHRRLIDQLGAEAILCVPLVARERTLGVLLLAGDSAKLGCDGDWALAEALASRAAMALDKAALYRQAQNAARRHEEVIGVVAHDLRNALNVVVMMVAALQRELEAGPLDPRRQRRIEAVERSADKMAQLIEDLVDATCIEGSGLQLRREPLAIGELIEEACAAIEPIVAARSLLLRLEIDAGCPLLQLDRRRMQQVLGHLLTQAIRRMEEGGSIVVRVEHDGAELRCHVSDTGTLIDEAELPHVFHRLSHGPQGGGAAAGLGLAIARGVIEAHGGTIHAESRPGGGTTIRFHLPIG